MGTTLTYSVWDETTELRELVLASQAGDREAFGALCLRFEQAVIGIGLRRLGNLSEAQDLCQDVFLQALEKMHQVREPEAFPGWLLCVANRTAINRITKARSRNTFECASLEGTIEEQDTPLESAIAGEERRELRAGLARLGAMDRETLTAFYVDGQSLNEMSDAFSAPLGTIKRRLHTARKRLAREVLDSVELDEELVAV
ncbi:MAG: RNA polymerase sigma factor [Planctomycetaceae bacterium]